MIDFEFNTALLIEHAAKLGIAFALALPLGWNRERSQRSAGLRTFPIVALASCGFVLVARDAMPGSPDALSRVIEGIITGIGFVGGGAIVRSGDRVRGTATAASIWATGAIGISVALRRYEVGVLVALVTFACLCAMPLVKNVVGDNGDDHSRANE